LSDLRLLLIIDFVKIRSLPKAWLKSILRSAKFQVQC
jgi:hypothetical protein